MTHHMANAFFDANCDVRLVAPKGACMIEKMKNRYQLIEDSESAPKKRTGLEGYEETKRLVNLLTQLNNEKPIDRVLLLHPFYYGPAAAAFCKKNKVPLSTYFHGFELRSQLVHKDPIWKSMIGLLSPIKTLKQNTVGLLTQSNQLLVNSSVTAELIHSTSNHGKKTLVTGCGVPQEEVNSHWVDQEQKEKIRTEVASSLGITTKHIVGFLGRLVPSKNVDFLIKLIAQVEDVQLVILGDGPKAGELGQLAQELKCEDRVSFIGSVSDAEKWKYLKSLDLFILPSKILPTGQMEGFGIVLLEATVAGTPVAVSTYGGMKDFVLDKNGTYLDIDNLANSVEILSSYLQDESKRITHLENARKLLNNKLTYDAIIERLLEDWTMTDVDAQKKEPIEARIDLLKKQNIELDRKLKSIEESRAFRLSLALMKLRSQPWRVIILPWEIVKVLLNKN